MLFEKESLKLDRPNFSVYVHCYSGSKLISVLHSTNEHMSPKWTSFFFMLLDIIPAVAQAQYTQIMFRKNREDIYYYFISEMLYQKV